MFKGLGQLGDMTKLMKQAQEMQAKMAEMQAALETKVVIGEAGAGMVKARATAKGDVTGVEIDPSLFSAEDKEVVEDLIVAAIKDAQEKARAAKAEAMAEITGGLELPPGMKLPF